MRLLEKIAFNLLAFSVAASGLAYLWMKYGLASNDPFAVTNHPWQPAMLKIHVLSSPALLVLFGVAVNSHIVKKLAGRDPFRHRATGLVSLVTFGAAAISGYALPAVTDPQARGALVLVHLVTGGIFVLAYAAHLAWGARATVGSPGAPPASRVPCPPLDLPTPRQF